MVPPQKWLWFLSIISCAPLNFHSTFVLRWPAVTLLYCHGMLLQVAAQQRALLRTTSGSRSRSRSLCHTFDIAGSSSEKFFKLVNYFFCFFWQFVSKFVGCVEKKWWKRKTKRLTWTRSRRRLTPSPSLKRIPTRASCTTWWEFHCALNSLVRVGHLHE